MKKITRDLARARGLKTYYMGVPCEKAGHDSDRRVDNNQCCDCSREASREWNRRNADYNRKTSLEWQKENQEYVRMAARERYKANAEYMANYYQRNKEQILANAKKKYHEKKQLNAGTDECGS